MAKKTVALAELNINLGTRKQLEAMADDIGVELEEGMGDLDLAEAIVAAIDGLSDDEWENDLSKDAQEWSNKVNAAKKVYKESGKKASPPKRQAAEATEEEEEEPDDDGLEGKTVPQLKAMCKAAGIKGYGGMKKPELLVALRSAVCEPEVEGEPDEEPAPKATTKKGGKKKEPTAAELKKMKAEAKKKAEAGNGARKQVVSEKPYKPDTTAWHVTQVVKSAGKKGITFEKLLSDFEKAIKKAKLTTSNPEGRCRTIIGQAVRIKKLIRKDGDKYYPTNKLNKAA